MIYPLIAFTGYAGCGKDEAARPLLAAGYHRAAFGDIIKGIFDAQCRAYLGFSAFTEDRANKQRLRGLLIQGGTTFYEEVFRRFFRDLTPPCVNTRLMRVCEGEAWVERGGIIIELTRPGVGPCEPFEGLWLEELRAARLIHHTVANDGEVAALHRSIRALAGLAPGPQP